MNPTIQLIQLTVRFESQEKAQRHALTKHNEGSTKEQSGYLRNLNDRIKQLINPPQHQHGCQCA